MICEKCNKRKATAYFNKKRVCKKCFDELRGKKTMKYFFCVVCKAPFRSDRDPLIPLCSNRCRSRYGQKRFELKRRQEKERREKNERRK